MSTEPKWVQIARADLGVQEIAGSRHNEKILQYFRDVGRSDIKDDETPWCAAFVGSVLERAGIASTKSLVAKSYLNWGIPTDKPEVGTVVVFHTHGPKDWRGHVGFYIRETANYIYTLGGNQKNAVTIEPYPKSKVAGYRNPIVPSKTPSKNKDPHFEFALEAVLQVEGGYVNHPRDPGGPTNKGVTLSEFAAYKGVQLTDANRDKLIEQLKNISESDIRTIYWQNYWIPASCDELPPGISLYVFDTAVLHGVSIAKIVLQQALGVEVDGIIGPITKAAAKNADPAQIVYRMRDIRLERLRKSANWDVFGRGWTNRINAMLEEALRAIGITPAPLPEEEMPEFDEPKPQEESKHWSGSLTIWGVIITFLSAVLPVLGPIIGVDITAAEIEELGEKGWQTLQALGGLIGSIMAIYGRIRAKQAISTKPMTVKF